ncbi:helix-turn-helix transcriptional regulator [Tenacibaculum sp. 190524A02b]|uniref:helix-turn-helix domain-containing protein n=1 Tax=Tenacibaculum vairaonense TaxID=3137860 RepID=UPI0031FA67F8
MSVDKKIQKILNDLKLTGAAFSDEVNLSKASIYKMLRGETTKFNSSTAKAISKRFPQYTYEWLTGNDIEYISTAENSAEVTEIVNVVLQNKEKFMKNESFKNFINSEAKKYLQKKIQEIP